MPNENSEIVLAIFSGEDKAQAVLKEIDATATSDVQLLMRLGAVPQMPIYHPVDWIIDNTPLDVPLFAWASVWGVKE